MRLLSLAAFGAALLAAPAIAQPSFGVKAGLNTSFFSGDDAADNADPLLGFVGGLAVRLPVNPAVALQVEALYSQKGDTFDNAAGFDERTRLSYLEVPVAVRFGIPLSPLLDAGVHVGGYVGVPLDADISVGGEEATDPELNTDYGALIGLDVGSGPVYVEGRYTLGLTDAIDFDPVLGDDVDLKNQVVSFTIGYRFGGGRSY